MELVPASFNKGSCVQFLAQAWQQRIPDQVLKLIYVGDDLTDEHAFGAIRQLDGDAIRIGASMLNSKANVHLDSIDELYQALESTFESLD